MSKDYILTLEAIDRRLYSKDKSAPLARYSASGLDAPGTPTRRRGSPRSASTT